MRALFRRTTSKLTFFMRQDSIKSIKSDSPQISDDYLLRNAKDTFYSGNYAKALYCFEKLKESFLLENVSQDRIDDVNGYLIQLYMKFCVENIKNKNHYVALSYLEKLKPLKESKNDVKGVNEVLELMTAAYNALAAEFKQVDNYVEAINYTIKCKELSKKLGKSITSLNKDLEEMYSVKAKDFYKKGNLKKSIEFYEKLKEICLERDNTTELLKVYKILGHIYFDASQIRNAVQNFTKLKDLAENKQNYKKKMHAFQNIGICFQLIKDYKTALNNFKMLLQLAWKEKSIKKELLAYDYMSIQYFYLGDLEGARYYHDRTWKGITEKFNSPVRELSNKALEALKNRNKIPINKNLEPQSSFKSHMKSDTVTIGLPSPRTSSGESDLRYLPVYPIQKPEQTRLPRSRSSMIKVNQNRAMNKTLEIKKPAEVNSRKVKPFILLSHLSPTESVKNFFYVDQITNPK